MEENFFTAKAAALLCLIGAIASFLFCYFSIPEYIFNAVLTSILMIAVGVLFLSCTKIKHNILLQEIVLNILFIFINLIVLHRFYPLYGGTAWSASFIVLLITLLRSEIMFLISAIVIMITTGLYFYFTKSTFISIDVYNASNVVSLFIVAVAAYALFYSNQKRTGQLSEQLKLREDDVNYVNQLNESLSDEILFHTSTQSALKASEKKNKSIVNALPDNVLILDKNGNILDNRLKEAYKISLDIQGNPTNIRDVTDEDVAERSLETIERVLESNTVSTLEYDISISDVKFYYEMRIAKIDSNEVITIIRDITESKERHAYIEYLSYHDQLTGLYNRRFFEEEFERLNTSRNYPLSIAVIDINGLKLVNDTFGHIAGDNLLKTMADILRNQCRSSDIIARIGGDEFTIFLPNTTSDQIDEVSNRIYEAMSTVRLDNNIILSASIGWATKDSDEMSINDIFEKAEISMYQKKLVESQSMRNQTVKVILESLNEKNKREKIHSQRVGQISKNIGIAMKLGDNLIKELEITGIVHDIGKISVNESVLKKKTPLSFDDYEEVKNHSKSGYQILRSVDSYQNLAEHVLSIHEHWDGSGYPRKLRGEEISLVARIVAIAEAYDAMTSETSYKEPISKEEALKELREYSGTQFAPEIVDIFISNTEIILKDIQ